MINAMVDIQNLPHNLENGYVVARQVDGELWYYGTYETEERANEVATMLGNGLYIKYGNY